MVTKNIPRKINKIIIADRGSKFIIYRYSMWWIVLLWYILSMCETYQHELIVHPRVGTSDIEPLSLGQVLQTFHSAGVLIVRLMGLMGKTGCITGYMMGGVGDLKKKVTIISTSILFNHGLTSQTAILYLLTLFLANKLTNTSSTIHRYSRKWNISIFRKFMQLYCYGKENIQAWKYICCPTF